MRPARAGWAVLAVRRRRGTHTPTGCTATIRAHAACGMSTNLHIPPNYVVERFSHSSKAARGEDLQVEHPVWCGYAPAFHFYPTLPGMLGAALIWDEVVQVGEPREKRLLAPTWMMEPLHREEFPLDGVMGLIEQGAGHGHLGICKHRIPARSEE